VHSHRPLIIYEFFDLTFIRFVHIISRRAHDLDTIHTQIELALLSPSLVRWIIIVSSQSTIAFNPLEYLSRSVVFVIPAHAIDYLLRAEPWLMPAPIVHLIMQF